MVKMFLWLHQVRLAGGGIMFSRCPSVRPSVRPFVCYQTCEHDILTTILMQICTSGSRCKGMKRSTLKDQEVKGQDHTRPGGGIILDPFGRVPVLVYSLKQQQQQQQQQYVVYFTGENNIHAQCFVDDDASISHFHRPGCTPVVAAYSARCQHHL